MGRPQVPALAAFRLTRMPTVIGFSGTSGDYIMVEQDITAVAAEIDRADGLVGFTITPGQDQSFRAGEGYVNPERVAYLRDAGGSAP